MIIKTATFNLFQFCSPEFSFYTKKENLSWLGKEKKLDKRATTKNGLRYSGFSRGFFTRRVKRVSFRVWILIVCKNAIEINSSEELYKQADDNLYEAKRSGRNCVVIK